MPRASFSSTATTSTAATLTSAMVLDQNNSEPYAGATFEAVPSSIVSFHHPHSFQSSNLPSPHSSGNLEQRGRRLTESEPLVLSSAEQSRSSSRNPSHFRFFTQEQISNAEGASTLENTDYDMAWDATPLMNKIESMVRAHLPGVLLFEVFPEHHLSQMQSLMDLSVRGVALVQGHHKGWEKILTLGSFIIPLHIHHPVYRDIRPEKEFLLN